MMKFWIALFYFFCFFSTAQGGDETSLHLRNDSEKHISIYWINPNNQERVLLGDKIEPNAMFTMNSFVSHKFEAVELPDPQTGICGSGGGKDDSQSCKVGLFQATVHHQQDFIVHKDMKVQAVELPKEDKITTILNDIDLDAVKDPIDTLAECKARAYKKLEEMGEGDEDIIHDELHKCITVGLAPRVKALDDEVEFERDLRVEASSIAENFTCVKAGLESSPDIVTEEWIAIDNVARTKHIKLDRSASRIHVVENFASPAECKAMEEEAEKDLHVAATADGKGGSKISVNRKAMQAGIKPKFTEEGDPLDGNLIAVLSGRVYEYVNHVLDLNISHHGQEPLMSIQYFGRGKHDIEPDRYTPHCDGICSGEEHVYGSRMATMVIYCKIPEKGGHTNFQNANVHVKPKPGDAVFFSYFDPLTNITDHGLTQHSGCPVYEGEKKIITQWVRYGVDSKTPHSAYNTLNILNAEDGE